MINNTPNYKIFIREYRTWAAMKNRCLNSNNPMYNRYGRRGIKVCKRWYLFENFIKDMGLKPLGLTIERINNNGDYTPGNYKWAIYNEQNNNKNSNKKEMIILPETIKAGVNEILIEKNIPIPTDNKLYFFGTMRIGDSSFVKGDYSIQRSILSGARRYYPKKFTTRQVVENKISGYRYWRTI